MPFKVNERLQQIFALEKLTSGVYRANVLKTKWNDSENVYGGLLVAQSLLAAQFSLDPKSKLVPHAIHSFFTKNGDSARTINYTVEDIRNGRSFASRYVKAIQDSRIVMSSQKESTTIEHQLEMPKVPGPDELVNGADFCRSKLSLFERREIQLSPERVAVLQREVANNTGNIFELRCCTPMQYYGFEEASKVKPFYFWMRIRFEIGNHPDMHRFFVAYLSDLTPAIAANRPYINNGYTPSMLLSLDHTIHFHDFNYHADQWLLYENRSTWAKHGRAYTEGRVWTLDGRLILSTSQESLSRSWNKKSSL